MVTEIRRKKEPVARKSRWVETAAAITHYLTGMSHRDRQEDTSAALTSGWLLLRERPPFLTRAGNDSLDLRSRQGAEGFCH